MKWASHKNNSVWFQFYEVPRVIKFIDTKRRIVVPGLQGKGVSVE